MQLFSEIVGCGFFVVSCFLSTPIVVSTLAQWKLALSELQICYLAELKLKRKCKQASPADKLPCNR